MQNHWWQVVLYVTGNGLTTSPIPYEDRAFEIEFDFVDHALVIRTSDGDTRTLPLVPRPVADFYADYKTTHRSPGIDVRLRTRPVEMADTTPFNDAHEHAS